MAIPRLNERLLKPFLSFQALVLPNNDFPDDRVWAPLLDPLTDNEVRVVASGLANPARVQEIAPSIADVRATAFILERRPAWGGLGDRTGNEFKDRDVHLVVQIRRGRLVAVHSTWDRLVAGIRRRAEQNELGGVGVLASEALQTALLDGEIRTLWMGEGAARRARGARSKAISGRAVDVDIDPIGDQRHTLSAARAEVTEELLGPGAGGSVGASLDRGTVWYRRAADWRDFLTSMERLLDKFEQVIAAGGGHDRFTVFAKKAEGLGDVESAYELGFEEPSLQPQPTDPEADEELQWLTTAVVEVKANGRTGLIATVVDENRLTAQVSVVPRAGRGRRVWFEVGRSGGDEDLYIRFRDALERAEPAVYYESGHTVTRAGVIIEHFSDISFNGWEFDPFHATDVGKEKPATDGRSLLEAIGALDATNTDDSLFAWAIRRWSSGWLYCDDRTDEMFDFVHFDPIVGEIKVIHIKKSSRSDLRRIAAEPYQEVCAQVVKNLTSVTRPRLIADLELRFESGGAGPLWRDGVRSDAGAKFVGDLAAPRASEKYLAVVVQPHVSDRILMNARMQAGPQLAGDAARLRRLEHLLAATDSVVSRIGGRLQVISRSEQSPGQGNG